MRYGSLPNWDRAQMEHTVTAPAPFDAWTTMMSESEESSRSGSEHQADRHPMMLVRKNSDNSLFSLPVCFFSSVLCITGVDTAVQCLADVL